MNCCTIVQDQFDADRVARELVEREQKGPEKTTRRLVGALSAAGVEGRSLLDIGAGFGDIQMGLFEIGLARACHVEISEPYGQAAHEIALRGGCADRVERHVGDFVALAGEIAPVDIVTLDRVICCYADMPALLDASLPKASHVYAISVPRSAWPVRLSIALENLQRRLRKNPFRMYVHSTGELDRIIRQHGFEQIDDRSTLMWRITVYRRVRTQRHAAVG